MDVTEASSPVSTERWCALGLPERREILAGLLAAELAGAPGAEAITGVTIEPGGIGREYDLTAVVATDVGRLRAPLWSHARAMLFCDESVHPANRVRFGPELAAREAADGLRARLAVPFQLESRGLTLTLAPEPGVERTWTAEHSLFRKRTAVVREDRVERVGEVDVRDLLAHFYTGPSLRLVGEGGEAFLLPAQVDVEGPAVTLCHACGRWSEELGAACPSCGSDRVEAVIAARAPRR